MNIRRRERSRGRSIGPAVGAGIGRSIGAAAIAALLAAGCGSDESPAEPGPLLVVTDARPGDLVGLVADDDRRVVSWIHRRDGTIHELAIDDADATPSVIAAIDVSTDSEQGGLLDQAILDDERRAVAFTSVDDELVFAVLVDGELTTVWNAGAAGGGAIGGKVTTGPGPRTMTMSVGRNVDWFETGLPTAFEIEPGEVMATTLGDQGAILTIADTLDAASVPKIISFGYTNPWATAVVGDEEIWVWDNAAGPDPDDPDADDVERIGRADLVADRRTMTRSDLADRAPADMVELPDGRLGVCGFLDNELRAYEIIDGPGGARTALERSGTIMPCNTGAAVFADGTIVTAAQTPDGESLQIRRP